LHGHYLNFPLLFKFLERSGLPVVVHLHDCWILSGKCTHPTTYKCDGWLNTCKNCPAFFAAAEKYGIIPIAGMELTTSEDIHTVCLFETLDDALKFDAYIDTQRVKIKNRPEFFGEQYILDSEDNIVATEPYLLSNATDISVDDVYDIVDSFGGVSYPAHIDRDANGIIAVLGTIPQNSKFRFYEINDAKKIEEYSKKYNINKEKFIVSSDAHTLETIRDKENFFSFNTDSAEPSLIRKELFKLLRGEI
jgi:hypothetical protein